MTKSSAGIVLFRKGPNGIGLFLVHPGGPFWSKKDDGSWSIPKGLYEEGEEPLVAAKREFTEETGLSLDGPFFDLGKFKQPSGKTIFAWATEGDFDPDKLKSNNFTIEWPPRSGKLQEFPEVDRAQWFSLSEAKIKLTKGQVPIVSALAKELGVEIQDRPETSKFDKSGQGSLF